MDNMNKKFNDVYDRQANNMLLTGNGFNLNFGYDSSYKNIFEKMRESDGQSYNDFFFKEVEENDYDLEKVSGKHQDPLAQKAIKMDFIKALMKIMQDAEDNKKEAADFISQFNKIFTLNYDPFLYKIGLYLDRKSRQSNVQYSTKIQELQSEFNKIQFPNEKSFADFNKAEKATLLAACVAKRKTEFRKEAMTYFAQEENQAEDTRKMDDGFTKEGKRFLWRKSADQNLFYLHGALHIYKDSDNQRIEKTSVGRLDTLKSRFWSDLIKANFGCYF